jgi:hypothetical protein
MMKKVSFLLYISLYLCYYSFAQKDIKPCHEGDLWGYCDENGKILIKQEYQKAYRFNGEIGPVVRDDGMWWFVNKKGYLMFNSRRWSDQLPMEPQNGVYKVSYFDPTFGNVDEYYNKAGFPVKVDSVYLKADTIPYKIFRFQDALKIANSKLGIPYGLNGMDCSGFIRSIFGPFGIILPYYASEISEKGRDIKLEDLKPGDLVFFAGSNQYEKTVNHVGFVTGKLDKEFSFIHASSSKGVVINKSSDGYYKVRFLFARRLFG